VVAHLLAAHPRVRTLDEPLIGAHLGLPASTTVGAAARSPQSGQGSRALDVFGDRDDYFFSTRYADAWRAPLRRLLLTRLLTQFRDKGGEPGRDTLVVKEPHGSEAADLLAETLPTSRLLIVVRDGRDVLDSILDAVRPGAWASSLAVVESTADARLRFLEDYAALWAERTRVVLRTRAALDDQRQKLVRYEDLLADPMTGVADIVSWLGLPPLDGLAEHVERLSFDRIDSAYKGSGKFHRAAEPGLWRANLSPAEQVLANGVMGPQLAELGYPVD
jgi:hypothetical protein